MPAGPADRDRSRLGKGRSDGGTAQAAAAPQSAPPQRPASVVWRQGLALACFVMRCQA